MMEDKNLYLYFKPHNKVNILIIKIVSGAIICMSQNIFIL